MILNLTEVLTAEGRTETKQVDFTPSVLEYGGQHYTITEKSPVTLTIANQGKGRAWLTGEMKLTALLSCDRCLKDVSYPFSLEFSCRVISPELEAAVSEDEGSCLYRTKTTSSGVKTKARRHLTSTTGYFPVKSRRRCAGS